MPAVESSANFSAMPPFIKSDWLKVLKQHRAIAVIRTDNIELGLAMAKAVAAGGGRLIEVTWNSDRPAALIETLRTELPHCMIGCGTLLNLSDLQMAISAGAQFGFTPHVDEAMICYGREHGLRLHPGALSPTEIVAAWNAGASAVKVFPVGAMGGADYIRSLQGPLGQIPLIPTGGVTLRNAEAFIRAGAIAIGLAGDLFEKEAIIRQDWQSITEKMQGLVKTLKSIEEPPKTSLS
jgi:2-dehydro-3-deoxyphosphogluconate aldolase / (4S)-4-hydroxy-2-oxoglutarate aldolase